MPFLNKTDLRFEDGCNWRLLHDLVYLTHDGDRITVPAGFETDLASVPQLLWSIIGPPAGRWAPAGCVHDLLYRTGLVPRSVADRIFREACDDLGVDGVTRWSAWVALRLFGWSAYRRNERITGASADIP